MRARKAVVLLMTSILLVTFTFTIVFKPDDFTELDYENHGRRGGHVVVSKNTPLKDIGQFRPRDPVDTDDSEAGGHAHDESESDANRIEFGQTENENENNGSSTSGRDRLCDMECWRFRELLQTWPDDKPKAAIYYLTHRFYFLNKSLHNLDLYFNRRFKYPIVVFHEKSFRPMRREVLKLAPGAYFQEIEFKPPSFLSEPIPENIPCLSPVSYRHMCRFQAKLIYEEPIMEGLDYYWRLDDDSLINEPIKYDVFSFMRDSDMAYGYRWAHLDSFQCTLGLWNAATKFIETRNITPYFFDQWPSPRIYYNNFEISAMSIWKSQNYKDYIEYIDRLGGIYNSRWGDAPIKGIAVSLFVQQNRTHLFSDIAYEHASYDSRRVRS